MCCCCSDEDLVKKANEWTIEGKDLISEVTCSEPYEWKELTDGEWEFSEAVKSKAGGTPFHVRSYLAFTAAAAPSATFCCLITRTLF